MLMFLDRRNKAAALDAFDRPFIAMLEFWKRKEKRVALEWGMIGFEKGERYREGGEGGAERDESLCEMERKPHFFDQRKLHSSTKEDDRNK